MTTKEELAKRIRRAREDARMSQEELGRLWGKSHAAISDIERGATSVSVVGLSELAHILNKDVGYFYEERPHDAQVSYLRGGRTEEGKAEKGHSKTHEEFVKFARQELKKQKRKS